MIKKYAFHGCTITGVVTKPGGLGKEYIVGGGHGYEHCDAGSLEVMGQVVRLYQGGELETKISHGLGKRG